VGRFLFVVPPLTGHVNPTVPLGRELAERGHAVAWAGHTDVVAGLLPPSATFLPVAEAVPAEVSEAVAFHTSNGTRGPAGFMASWQEFVLPVARQMVPGVHAAIDRFGPDVLVVDQQALAGAAVADLRDLPWATTATTSAELVDPLAVVPKMGDWLRDRLRELLVAAGLDADRAASFDPRFSPHLVLALTTAELVGPVEGFPDHYALVGPLIGDRPDDTPFPWDWLDDAHGGPDAHGKPLVLVSLGTLNWRGGERFFAAAADALRAMDARAVFVAPAELVPDPPPNVLVAPRVPQLALLPHVDAVVSHGGHNTVCEALAQGLPLVIAPIRDDQPVIADQVAAAGAGIRVKFGRITADALRHAIESVLTEPGYRAAAERVRASFASAGGAPMAADRLEGLLTADRSAVGGLRQTLEGS
jgi:MGT family glycosyltransferase